MNRKLIFVLFMTFAVGLVGCTGNVPASPTDTVVVTEPTATLPPTAVPTDPPTAMPTEEPTTTPTEVPSPTPTMTPVTLAEWAAANGFQHVGAANEQYYEKRTAGGIAFWVQDYEDPGGFGKFRQVAVRIPNNAPTAAREEALNAWAKNLSELFIPAVAGRVSGLQLSPGEETDIQIGGSYYGLYEARDMGRGDTALVVTVSVPPPPIDPYLYLYESVEAVAGGDCLSVIPADADLASEKFISWMNQYLDRLAMESLGEERFTQDSEVFLLPLGEKNPDCIVVLYRDAASGKSFLIYETAGGIVKVPFEVPSVP